MRKKTALILRGDWEGHAPQACADLFAPWLASRGFRVQVADTLDVCMDRRLMRRVSLIVPIWTMGNISAEQWAGLRDAVLDGAGVAGWHGGMCDAFRTNTEYQFMTGGQWVAHPGGVIPHRIRIVKPSDPIGLLGNPSRGNTFRRERAAGAGAAPARDAPPGVFNGRGPA